MQVSIDPGVIGTGLCVWDNGKPRQIVTCYSTHIKKTLSYTQKIEIVVNKVLKQIREWVIEYGPLEEVVVEQFQDYTPCARSLSLRKLQECTGAICASISLNFSVQIDRVSKGTTSKHEANTISKYYGFKGSQHAKDALHLGLLHGYDRRRKEGAEPLPVSTVPDVRDLLMDEMQKKKLLAHLQSVQAFFDNPHTTMKSITQAHKHLIAAMVLAPDEYVHRLKVLESSLNRLSQTLEREKRHEDPELTKAMDKIYTLERKLNEIKRAQKTNGTD